MYHSLSEPEKLFNQGKNLSERIKNLADWCTEPLTVLIQNPGYIPNVQIQEMHVANVKTSLSKIQEKIEDVKKWLIEVEQYLNRERATEYEKNTKR